MTERVSSYINAVIKIGEAASEIPNGLLTLWQGVRGVTPYSVGSCHEATEGTGDRWEHSHPNKTVNHAQRRLTDAPALPLGLTDEVIIDI